MTSERIFNIENKVIPGKDRNSYIQYSLDGVVANESPTQKSPKPVTPVSSGKVIPFRRPPSSDEDEDKNDAWSDLGYLRR